MNEYAYLGTMISATVALATLAVALVNQSRTKKREEVREWQRVAIYQIINSIDKISFEDIRSKYLQEAQQLNSLELPRTEIQNGSLVRELLKLQADRAIQRNKNGTFSIRRDDDERREQMVQMFMSQAEIREEMIRLEHTIVSLVREQDGKLTEDALVLRLQDSGVRLPPDKIGLVMRHLMTNQVIETREMKVFLGTPGRFVTRTVVSPLPKDRSGVATHQEHGS